jgi:hypothetical protein
MRQQRHTTAYAPSWQPSGDRTAPHGHSSEKSPDLSAGAPQSDGRYQHQSGKLWKRPPETQALPTADDGAVDHPAALSVCSTGRVTVLLLTAKQLRFQATPATPSLRLGRHH